MESWSSFPGRLPSTTLSKSKLLPPFTHFHRDIFCPGPWLTIQNVNFESWVLVLSWVPLFVRALNLRPDMSTSNRETWHFLEFNCLSGPLTYDSECQPRTVSLWIFSKSIFRPGPWRTNQWFDYDSWVFKLDSEPSNCSFRTRTKKWVIKKGTNQKNIGLNLRGS